MRAMIPLVVALLGGVGLAGCGAPPATLTGDVPAARIADAALESGNPDIVLRVVGGMLAKNPRDVGALLRQGTANAMLGQSAAAEHSFRRVLAIEPGNRKAQLGLARAMLAINPAEAEKLYTAYLRNDPRNLDALNDLGVARDMQGHHPAAQLAYRQALAISPDMVSARQNLGLSLAMSGQAGEGAAMISQVVADGAADQRTRDDYALALTLDGHRGEAGKMLRQDMSDTDVNAALAAYSEFSATTPSAVGQ
jgi:Flp pilus assembly protein TadD